MFAFTNWLEGSKLLIQFRGKAVIRGGDGAGGKGKEEWKLQIKKMHGWLAF